MPLETPCEPAQNAGEWGTPMSTRIDVVAIARELAPGFAERAAACDQTDAFVAESYANLKKRKLFSSGVPLELGGGGDRKSVM